MSTRRRSRRGTAIAALLTVLFGTAPTMLATTAAATTAAATTTAAPPDAARKRVLTVMVTNDDGVAAPGIDAVVEALRHLPRTKVAVVAPAQNHSGTGGKLTEGAAVTASPATTASGYAATAVDGYPADTVNYALDVLGLKPHAVISGSNSVQNLGPFVDLSGTVGAARQAARRGIPALAVSQQIGDAPDYPASARLAAEWLADERRALLRRKTKAPLTTIDSINAPNCPGGRIRGLVDVPPRVPPGDESALRTTSDCASTATTFADDVEAFNHGFATISQLPVP